MNNDNPLSRVGPGSSRSEVEIQRTYYAATAPIYEAMHNQAKDEHFFALRFLEAMLEFYDIKSVLDIGAGTGRVARYLKSRLPGLKVMSIEPVAALREVGYANGLSREELVDGDATRLDFRDGQFDLVCEFAVLHHIKSPASVVAEMLRVARKGIFISDSNNFGQGSPFWRAFKQAFNAVGLWGPIDWVKTRGKGYTISEGDGLAYSYSVFNDYRRIAKACHIHLVNTMDGGRNPYRTASHVALLGIKKSSLEEAAVSKEAPRP